MIRRARIGRPGLIGTAARTAVVAGTASATVGAVSRRQQRRAYGQQQEYAPQQPAYEQPVQAAPAAAPVEAAPAGGDDDLYAQLQQLGQLHAQGILSDDEFAQAKAKILG